MISSRPCQPDLSDAKWHKSTYSGGNNECVEVARFAEAAAVRDSKHPDGPALVFSGGRWNAFLTGMKSTQPHWRA
ncbi:DUF397 domain-containing protein [Streptomyces sp. SP18CS02]|uniref:DUF397 domain-containing protein n=1 Tax=Streptomyces sp. SP18CS02 TaxID=3002531 RepID=UPI002E7718DE|nr:DUF397 domain-containing protein [Streptomyces sp. SP18CS02]MEE1755775.1 DUF397 domain-containing protein [Streptomyces sp. SP18CS02]